jgi:hypothetical protein
MGTETLIAILLVAAFAAMMVWSFRSDGDDEGEEGRGGRPVGKRSTEDE